MAIYKSSKLVWCSPPCDDLVGLSLQWLEPPWEKHTLVLAQLAENGSSWPLVNSGWPGVEDGPNPG